MSQPHEDDDMDEDSAQPPISGDNGDNPKGKSEDVFQNKVYDIDWPERDS
jgi:hypothetical protein